MCRCRGLRPRPRPPTFLSSGRWAFKMKKLCLILILVVGGGLIHARRSPYQYSGKSQYKTSYPAVYIESPWDKKVIKRPGAHRYYANMPLRDLLNLGGVDLQFVTSIEVLRPTINVPFPTEGQHVFVCFPNERKNKKVDPCVFSLKQDDLVIIHTKVEWIL